ncbi:hypothetical protein I3760_05G091100 [Carya illinoinensis]|nr:hypothetical protein I3760_05G091100 [Carya illinoinensis]
MGNCWGSTADYPTPSTIAYLNSKIMMEIKNGIGQHFGHLH